MLHGTTLNQIQDIYGVFYRAARQVLADIDPQETICIETTNPIFSGVWDYPVPVDLKGNKIIDIAPQINRLPSQIANQSYNQQFDTTKYPSWKLVSKKSKQWMGKEIRYKQAKRLPEYIYMRWLVKKRPK